MQLNSETYADIRTDEILGERERMIKDQMTFDYLEGLEEYLPAEMKAVFEHEAYKEIEGVINSFIEANKGKGLGLEVDIFTKSMEETDRFLNSVYSELIEIAKRHGVDLEKFLTIMFQVKVDEYGDFLEVYGYLLRNMELKRMI